MPTPALPLDLPGDGSNTLAMFDLSWARFYAGEPDLDLDTRVLLAAMGFGDECGRAVFGWGVLAETIAAPGPFALAYAIAAHVEAERLWPGSSERIMVPTGDWLRIDVEPGS